MMGLRSRNLGIEQLEQRKVLAVSVTTGGNGDIFINGDAGGVANDQIAVVATPDTYFIFGGPGTPVNGLPFATPAMVDRALVSDDVRINLGQGDNFAGLIGLSDFLAPGTMDVADDISVDTGGGVDSVLSLGLSVDEDFHIRPGSGHDTVIVAGGFVRDDLKPVTGAGNDIVLIDSVQVQDDADIETGNTQPGGAVLTLPGIAPVPIPFVDDLVFVGNSAMGEDLLVTGGAGGGPGEADDALFLFNLLVADDIITDEKGGTDVVLFANADTGEDHVFELGSGDDAIVDGAAVGAGFASLVGEDTHIDCGAGINFIFDAMDPAGRACSPNVPADINDLVPVAQSYMALFNALEGPALDLFGEELAGVLEDALEESEIDPEDLEFEFDFTEEQEFLNELFFDQQPAAPAPEDVQATLEGDLNGDGTVNQADLDLVLLHWGDDVTEAPAGTLASGIFDQTELDHVLTHWGQSL